MKGMHFECLTDFTAFQAVRHDWNRFMQHWFPENYARTHTWLAAWLNSYHQGKQLRIYLQRDTPDGPITALAPLLIRQERFGGFPVRSVQSIGSGIGCDDFLLSPDSSGFVPAVLNDLRTRHSWDVCRLQRTGSELFRQELGRTLANLGMANEQSISHDYAITLPASYEAYQQTRTRKFRRNYNQALNRLERHGALSLELLDPFRDAERVKELGNRIAAGSWQFKSGKSHFNNTGSANLYASLARAGNGADGEEFTVLLVAERPVAYLLGCRKGQTYYAVDTAFHDDFRMVSAGRILFGMLIKRLIEEGGIERFDFEGSGDYKDDYATDYREAVSYTIYNHGLYPRCIRSMRSTALYGRLRRFMQQKQPQVTCQKPLEVCS